MPIGPSTVPVSSVNFGAAAWRPLPPFVLEDRYAVDAEVGLTANGALFSGRDLKAERQVSVLLFHPAFFSESRHRVQRGRLDRALTYEHPDLARTALVGEAFGTVYAVTAPIVGLPMTHWRRDAGRIELAVVYRLVGQLIEAVSVIHAAGGVHGSLSPDTLRIVNGRAFVTNPWTLDVPPELPAGELPAPRTSWLAPELQYGGSAQGAETDVYGIGLALGYLLACGLTEPGHSLLVQGIDVPPAVDDVYVRATARQKEARYRDLRELASALEAAGGFEWREAQRDDDEVPFDRGEHTPPDGLPIGIVTGVFPAVAPPSSGPSSQVITRPRTARRGTIVGLPVDGAVRSLGVEVLESRAIEPAAPVMKPTILAARLDVESTSEDEAIPAFPLPVPEAAAGAPDSPEPEALIEGEAADTGVSDSIGVLRAGRRKPVKTLVGGSPRTGPHDRPAPPVELELVPRAPEPESPPESAPPPIVTTSLESLDLGALPASGGPPPLPPPSRPSSRPTLRPVSAARLEIVAEVPEVPPPPAPPAIPPEPPPEPAAPVILQVSAAVETAEPTIVEPFAPSLLEHDVFGVASSTAPPRAEAASAGPPAIDPFTSPPPPPIDPLNDSIFASTTDASRTVFERPTSDVSLSAGALALPSVRGDSALSRPLVVRPYGAVPAHRARRFPWLVGLATLAGVIVAIVLFTTLGSDDEVAEGGVAPVLAATTPAPTAPALATTPPATSPTTAPALAPDVSTRDASEPDTSGPGTSPADVTPETPETIDEVTIADVTPEVAPDVTPDVPLIDTVVPDTVALDVWLAAVPPAEDALASVPDAAQTPDTLVSEADATPAEVVPADAAPVDAGPSPTDAQVDFVPKDPAKLTCPGGMSKLKKKIKVTLDDGRQVDDWEVACIDYYEYPGAGATPSTGLDLGGARAACTARGKRLCTRSEWRRACGGTYPYGSTYESGRCATASDEGAPGAVVAAGSKKGCRSPSGAYDMVGNVAEWTSDGAVNGGSAFKNAADGTCNSASRRVGGASYVGFRCCADAK
ncbi:MAG: SUMF1/EgtB/PvdO family nonheme iron enzyme [Deltaproteobacteria bacterium]|nr:SUMF1/EgtB/PvdO family nonheme iron enzyme [Deltaproteobacteria bacterium]